MFHVSHEHYIKLKMWEYSFSTSRKVDGTCPLKGSLVMISKRAAAKPFMLRVPFDTPSTMIKSLHYPYTPKKLNNGPKSVRRWLPNFEQAQKTQCCTQSRAFKCILPLWYIHRPILPINKTQPSSMSTIHVGKIFHNLQLQGKMAQLGPCLE